MRISALLFSRYRAFKDFHKVPLAPVTVIIGKNGGGKSVLARLPLLLAQALSENAEGPLDLSAGGIEHAASFFDLVHSRSALPFMLGTEISSESRKLEFRTTLRYVNETRSLSIEQFDLYENDIKILTLSISDASQLDQTEPEYILTLNDEASIPVVPEFKGLFPRDLRCDHPASPILREALRAFQAALTPPSYLGPFRAEPARSMRTPNQIIRNLGPRGERSAELLADDRLRRTGALADEVGAWFGRALEGQEIKIDVSGDEPKLFIADRFHDAQVSLADTGAGFAQVLPVVVQNFAHRHRRITASLLIVEQPELHLHPAAHGEVCDLVWETAVGLGSWSPPTCIVETHSEQFIMRLRRRAAETTKTNLVKLVSVNHRESLEVDAPVEPIRIIGLDESGNPDTWPAGVFEEALHDLTAMRQHNRERGL